MNKDYAIIVDDVSKLYKLYTHPRDRLKDSLGLTRRKNYREHYALHNVTFGVKKGECVGIIGTNGAGKSTILKIITGVLSPTEGNVEIDGRISALLELGAGFNMEYTGVENIYLNGTMIGFSKQEIDERLDDILEFADIGEFVNQPVKTYSSGMFVRLAFAVAINIDPEILIVDEALSVGDAFFQAKCYKKFEEFKEAGKTILFVSHDLSTIQRYCDRAILLNKGHVIGEGLPSEMIDMYKRALVGQLDDEDTSGESDKVGGDSTFDNNSAPESAGQGDWKSNYAINPDLQDYGDKKIEIIDFAVIDNNGNYTDTLLKKEDFILKVKIRANETVDMPIVSYTLKTLKGVDITGTNTMFEKMNIGRLNPGDERVITFKQNMSLQGGQYLLSFGSTRYEGDEFCVSHRLYDVINLSVVSQQNTVGFYDMDSEVTINNVK